MAPAIHLGLPPAYERLAPAFTGQRRAVGRFRLIVPSPLRGLHITPGDLEILRAGMAAGRSYKLISRDTDYRRSIYGLRNTALRRGWRHRPAQRNMSADELEQIRLGVAAGETFVSIGRRLGRSDTAVCRRARRLSDGAAQA